MNPAQKEPVRAKSGTAHGGNSARSSAVYTCPMHPQIEQIGPGSCPICGMALEPKVMAPGDAEDAGSELRDMT
ncbi:MAG TPA: heavy metal-binding domain-containing protein, partial [Opitutaceae bacterium]